MTRENEEEHMSKRTSIDHLLSRREAAEHLGISLRTLDSLISERELVPVRIGSRVLFQPRELTRYADARRDDREEVVA